MNRWPEILAASAIALAIAGAVLAQRPSQESPTAVPAAATLPSGGTGEAFAISGVRMFDGERMLPATNVVVRDGRIESVGADVAIPAGIDVVERIGDDQLCLRSGVATDLAEFERHAARRSISSAEAALGRVRGPLLDGDELLVGHPEIDALREHVRMRRLVLLGRLVDAATTANDRAQAIEWATLAHAADLADEASALSLAHLLVADGRGGEARAVAADTVRALALLDLDPTPALRAAAS